MREVVNAEWKARFSLDDAGRVRQITPQPPWKSSQESPLEAAIEYLRRIAGVLDIRDTELRGLYREVSFLNPVEQGVSYRLGERKQFFDSTTILFHQTYLNVPVWRAGIAVTIQHDPYRVVTVAATHQEGMDARLPPLEKVEEYRSLFAVAKTDPAQTAAFVGRILGRDAVGEAPRNEVRIIRGRFFIYRYDGRHEKPAARGAESEPLHLPTLPLLAVDPQVKVGRWYVVSEVTFSLTTPRYGALNWRVLIDLETDSVLLLEPLVGYLRAMVFLRDPITSTGNEAYTPDQSNSVLDPLRNSVELPNLDGPVDGVQFLQGRFAVVTDINAPEIPPPTARTGRKFVYRVRTDEFAAVNAYYHTDRFFTLVESLGFPIARYFKDTTFPIRVDHRDNMGNPRDVIDARCVGNGRGGIDYVSYALNDLSNTMNPLGRACDSRVHLHELGGHGILYEHLDAPNFKFAHSAGDSFSAIFHDPGSRAPDRYRYAPWHPENWRRFNRAVEEGWSWGGCKDDEDYKSEQILATTLFRVYRSIGGDSTDFDRQRFASRMMLYLILRTVSTLTPINNPSDALEFANALMRVDSLNWTCNGIHGGAYHKVIRWSFEKQGLYQASGVPKPVARAGEPPDVDVYIDDGRGGEYPYQAAYWNNFFIWNRRAADGGAAHQEPVAGVTNYGYVRIKNRGTQLARNVRVRGYHRRFGGDAVWPDDFQPLATLEPPAGTLAARNAEEKVVGPFEWVPSWNPQGQGGLLMIVDADGDASNADHFATGGSIPEWRLVPNDNNIGLRNFGC